MSFAELEESQHDGQPVMLFKFSRPGLIVGYTSADHEVMHGGIVYSPNLPISIPAIERHVSKRSNAIALDVPRDHPVAKEFRIIVPASKMTLTIFVGHVGDSDFVFLWQGQVINVDWSVDFATLNLESLWAPMVRSGLPYKFGPQCQHTVYRGGCGLSLTANAVLATVTSVDGTAIYSSDLIGSAEGNYIAGLVVVDGVDFRTIVGQGADYVSVNRPFENLAPGKVISVAAGCDRSSERCKELGNFANYFAFNTLPFTNLFRTGLDT